MLRIEGAGLEASQILDLTRLLEQAGEIRAVLNVAAAKLSATRRARREYLRSAINAA